MAQRHLVATCWTFQCSQLLPVKLQNLHKRIRMVFQGFQTITTCLPYGCSEYSCCMPCQLAKELQGSGSFNSSMSSHTCALPMLQALRSQGKPPLAQVAADGARSSGGEGSDTQYTLLPGYISRPNASPYKRRRIQGPCGAPIAPLPANSGLP